LHLIFFTIWWYFHTLKITVFMLKSLWRKYNKTYDVFMCKKYDICSTNSVFITFNRKDDF
jgi:hypothetical protein